MPSELFKKGEPNKYTLFKERCTPEEWEAHMLKRKRKRDQKLKAAEVAKIRASFSMEDHWLAILNYYSSDLVSAFHNGSVKALSLAEQTGSVDDLVKLDKIYNFSKMGDVATQAPPAINIQVEYVKPNTDES